MPPKKKSAWISNRELKQMTANVVGPLPVPTLQYDYGDKLDPQLFYSWQGEHTEPPIWFERPIYKNPNLQATIQRWQEQVPVEPKPFGATSSHMQASLVRKGSSNFSFSVPRHLSASGQLYFLPPKHDEKLMGELVPRAWVPQVFEHGQNLQSFWQQQLNGPPKPQDESDFGDRRPFWDRYLVNHAAVQLFPKQPEHEKCDTSQDTPQDKEVRENDRGSQGWTNQYLQNPNGFMMARFARKAGGQDKGRKQRDDEPPKEPSFIGEEPMIDNTIKPVLSLFIRMAELCDIPQMTDIYNHYVLNSVCTPELVPITIENMKARWESSRSNHLPFLVACSPIGYGGRNRYKDRACIDTVLGFASADDVCGSRTAMRFTVEVGMFVSAARKSTRSGVSKCLMDKLLGLLDQFYIERGGYEIDDKIGLGTQRLVSRIMINLMHSELEGNKKWVAPYLESWGFKEKTMLDGFSYKLNQIVDNTIFYRTTGLVIVPTNPPIPPPAE
ncbi:hypothetical protein D6C92_03030 [Aureobasidium pullulans]|nr:hypothetical protein D6C92_03030 [Aureobasidium pullulans]